MNINKLLGNDINSLGIVDNLSVLIDIERKFLFNLFDIKEKIDKKLSDLNSVGLSTKNNELFNNLSASKEELFREFYLRYCTSRKLLEFSDKATDGDLVGKYNDVDKIVRLNVAKYIFLGFNKEQIFDVINNPLNFDEIIKIVKKFVDGFLDDLDEFISEQLNSPQFFSDFMSFYKKFIFSIILDSFNDYDGLVNLEKMLDIISDNLFVAIDQKQLLDAYINYLNKNSGKLNIKTDLLSDDTDALFGTVAAFINKLITDTNLKIPDGVDGSLVDLGIFGGDIADETRGFIKKYLSNNYNFDNLDVNKFKEIVCGVHLTDEDYQLWLKLFLGKFKLPISLDNIPFKSIADSDSVQNFILSLKNKYPKAKNHLGFITNSMWKTWKLNFISQYKKSFSILLESSLSNEAFKSLSLVHLNTIMYYYLVFLQKCNFDVSSDFEGYVKAILEERFKESHDKAVEIETKKAQRILQDREKQLEKEKQLSKKSGTKKNAASIRKSELPDGLVSELEKCFSGNLDQNLLRSLRNCGGVYKKSWFEKFSVDDAFFDILDRFGFVCEDISDDSIEEKAVNISDDIVDISTDSNVEADDEFIKLRNIIEQIKSTENIDDKIDYYIQAFESFYDFKDVKLFRSQVLESIKGDVRILKGIESVLDKILKGQKEELKTSKNWKKRYFTFDIAYNTGYRIVLNGQQGKSRKIIVDFVDHDTYLDRIPSYYCKY